MPRSETKTRERYLGAILSLYRKNLRPPTILELAAQLQVKSKYLYYLNRLRRQGLLAPKPEGKSAMRSTVLPGVRIKIVNSGTFIFWG